MCLALKLLYNNHTGFCNYLIIKNCEEDVSRSASEFQICHRKGNDKSQQVENGFHRNISEV
jgi:hypothetical protein